MGTSMRRRNTTSNAGTTTTAAPGGENKKPSRRPVPNVTKKRNGANRHNSSWWSFSSWSHWFLHGGGCNNDKDRTARWYGLNRSTWQATIVLIVAIVCSMMYNTETDPRVKKLIQVVVSRSKGENCFSHPQLVPARRTQTASRVIPANEEVLRMPRSHLIWDLDAFRDPFVQRELFAARNLNEQPLEADVFLAAYLARLLKNPSSSSSSAHHHVTSPVLKQYFEVLPTHGDYMEYHPLFWNSKGILSRLKISSATYDLVNHYRESMDETYDALCAASEEFESQISRDEYVVARLHVLTRSFGTGPLDDQDFHDESLLGRPLSEELKTYKDATGVDLSRGSHSMVPILDQYNHHRNPNVKFSYDTKQRAFVVTTVRPLAAGQELIDSYGKHSEAHLFAKYGFVSGDGSDNTQASLALYHPVYSHGMPLELLGTEKGHRIQAKRMARYLQFDDGYESCIAAPYSSSLDYGRAAFEFKVLKLRHLLRIAKQPKSWNIFVTPRNPKATPPVQTGLPWINNNNKKYRIPEFIPSQVQLDANPVMSTCRLISMTHEDYNGTATALLQRNLGGDENNDHHLDFFVPPRTQKRDPLQFREIMCILRFSEMAFHSCNSTLEEQTNLLRSLSSTKQEASSSSSWQQEWIVAYLKLAEMQALQVLKEAAIHWMRAFENDNDNNDDDKDTMLLNSAPEYTVRSAPCPLDDQSALVDHL